MATILYQLCTAADTAAAGRETHPRNMATSIRRRSSLQKDLETAKLIKQWSKTAKMRSTQIAKAAAATEALLPDEAAL